MFGVSRHFKFIVLFRFAVLHSRAVHCDRSPKAQSVAGPGVPIASGSTTGENAKTFVYG